MTLQEKIRILKELEQSKGWAVIKEAMHKAIVDCAMTFADGRPMPPEQFQFHRGALWAARRHLDLPSQLISMYENELLLTSDPATAGKIATDVSLRPDTNKE